MVLECLVDDVRLTLTDKPRELQKNGPNNCNAISSGQIPRKGLALMEDSLKI